MRVHARFSVVFRAFKKRQRGEILLKVALLIFVLLQTHLFIRYFDCDCGLRIYFLCVCVPLYFFRFLFGLLCPFFWHLSSFSIWTLFSSYVWNFCSLFLSFFTLFTFLLIRLDCSLILNFFQKC